MSRGACLSLTIALILAGASPATLAADAASPPPPAVAPPALQTLEQKLAQIRLNSVSFSTRLALQVDSSSSSTSSSNFVSVSSKGSHDLVISTSGVLSLSPRALSSTSTIEGLPLVLALGGVPLQERRIGATTYLYDPAATRHDGGRPWIRNTPSRKDEELAAKLAPLGEVFHPLLGGLEQPTASATGPFAPLLKELGDAQSIREMGPVTVDGQQTVEFAFALSTAKLFAGLHLPKESHRLARAKRASDTGFTLELWLAPSGLPVRATVTSGVNSEGFSSQDDILGLEVPVLVHAPLASRTIGQARWIKIERRHAKAVGRCLRRHPGRVHACLKHH
jgi:hypothetical protein